MEDAVRYSSIVNRGRRLFGLGCLVWLAACQTAPPAPEPDKQALRIAALKNLGFVPQDTGWELSLGVKLLFEPDADAVSDAGRQALDQVAHTLTEVGIDRVRVEGHTDNVGTARYNRALSLRRADSVAQQLVKAGWPEDSIERVGHGYDKPVADNATADGRAQNRRVVVTVRVD
jgi:outer membrane protein OmpA-like peptidoglycan-associated protein